MEDENEENDGFNKDRNIDHISQEKVDQMYATRLSEEQKQSLHDLWANFKGTKKYHNYTKEIKPHEAAACRYMMNMTANEYMYVNKNTLKVTDESDTDAIEFVRFYLKGQSFLFNQIRKMVGSMIQVFHGELGPGYIENTHKQNKLQVALSPGDGLLLERVAYDQYNSMPTTHSPIMIRTVAQQKEVDEYRKTLLCYIAKREIEDKAFTRWLCFFDDNKEDYYVSLAGQG